ncbi:MAG: phosphate-starvation-inducible PsiE family protein [Fischerella sp.]|nr:phosphate-starvation-inducible PsiE family protein [Fischerella sp.]
MNQVQLANPSPSFPLPILGEGCPLGQGEGVPHFYAKCCITSLIAVARKIIILDFEKISDSELLALAAAIVALSICYWLVRRTNVRYPLH